VDSFLERLAEENVNERGKEPGKKIKEKRGKEGRFKSCDVHAKRKKKSGPPYTQVLGSRKGRGTTETTKGGGGLEKDY